MPRSLFGPSSAFKRCSGMLRPASNEHARWPTAWRVVFCKKLKIRWRRAGCGRSACPVRRAGCGNGAMVEPVRHSQTKETATDMFEPTATAPHLDSSPPSFFWPSRARACSSVQPALPTPMTGTSRWPRLSGRGAMEISSCRRDHRSGRKGPCLGPGLAHGVPDLWTPAFSRCPPNSYRIAESSLFWKSASPRELKRS
jgi:hypothetical protein